MIKHRIVLISIVLLLVSYLSLTNFSNNIFYAHLQALAVKDVAMKYFPANILANSSNNTLAGSDKMTKFFVYENPIYGIKIDYPFGWDKLDFDQSNTYVLSLDLPYQEKGNLNLK